MNTDIVLAVLLTVLQGYSSAQRGDSCITPDNKQGECINIKQCPSIIMLLTQTRPIPPDVLEFLRRSQCGFDGMTPQVCCSLQNAVPPSPSQTSTTGPIISVRPSQERPVDASNHPNLRLLPLNICGPYTESKIFNGKKTELNEYPWMALIGYTRSGSERRVFRCGGTIINEKYVITAAHCIVSLPNTLKLAGVRFGEHDMSTDIDCMDDENGIEVCNPSHFDYDIDSAIPHPNYSGSNLQNDIGLLRIRGTANFRLDSVKPICLPIGADQNKNLDGEMMIVSGWGTTERGVASNILLKVAVPVVPLETCAGVYNRSTYRNPIRITRQQICAGGVNSEDSCDGDSGGPLISKGEVNSRPRFVQYGVVSFGPRSCGIKGFPAVYTNVPYYVDWILSNMKP